MTRRKKRGSHRKNNTQVSMNQQIVVEMGHATLSYIGGGACNNIYYEYETLAGQLCGG